MVEDQVTYPLTSAMLAVPKSKVVRGFSFFGASFVYVIFEDGTDIYWARSRVLEYLNSIAGRLPKNVAPQLGSDASGVGWVYQYAVLSEQHNLAQLRTMQDWYVRYQLTKAHGVAEVASIGGFVQQYQVTVDPIKLRAYNIPLSKISQDVIATALGGENVTTTVEGLERYGVNVRYPRELRGTPEQIAREVLVPTESGAMIPLGQLATVAISKGAPAIRTENALLSAYVYVDIRERDIGSFVNEARRAVNAQVKFPPGYYATWSGQFEYMERAIAKMKIVIPITLLIIFLLLYLNFKKVTESLVVMLSVPFALVGGVWLLWLLNYNLSVAVAVGFIALAGVAAETGVVMIIYLEHAWLDVQTRCANENRKPTAVDLYDAIMQGAVERVRPKMMTVVAIMAGLLPILWSTGTGSEVMRRIAAPMVGGMISSAILTLLVIPVIYALIKQRELKTQT